MKKKFSWKSLISFCLFFVFIIILFSGSILFLSPPGRISNWSNWSLFGLLKSQWQAIHTNFSYLFVILTIFHLFFLNWKVFWSYISSRTKSGLNKKLELLLSAVFSVLVFFGVLFSVPPFKNVMILSENLTESWEQETNNPPVPHAELLTIDQLAAEILKSPVENVIKKIEELGIRVDSTSQSLKDLVQQTGMSPQEIYNKLIPEHSSSSNRSGSGSGAGRKTISQISSERGIEAEKLILLLHNQGIEASENDVLRDIANRYDITPMEVLTILNNNEIKD